MSYPSFKVCLKYRTTTDNVLRVESQELEPSEQTDGQLDIQSGNNPMTTRSMKIAYTL